MRERDKNLIYTEKALLLAEEGRGYTSPNPLVGAVIVKNARIVGRGAHLRFGGPHAEINALSQAGGKARGATLYCTLEPCSTWGKTGPCTEAIIRSGITRVFVAAIDPNPENCGKGIRVLRRAGIKVECGMLSDRALKQNNGFVSIMTKGRPYIILKMAQSLDGKIATVQGESKWITSEESQQMVHKLRGSVDAVLVGTNTILMDNPRLTARNGSSKHNQPARIILDRDLKIESNARALRSNGVPSYYVTSRKNISRAISKLERTGAEVLGVAEKAGVLDMGNLMKTLVDKGITSILVEGGGEIAATLLKENLVDEVFWFIAPLFIGGRNAKTSVEGEGVLRLEKAYRLKKSIVHTVGNDIVIEGKF